MILVQVLLDLLRSTATFDEDRFVLEVGVDSIWTNKEQVVSDIDNWNGEVVLLQSHADSLIKLIAFSSLEWNWWSGEQLIEVLLLLLQIIEVKSFNLHLTRGL